MVLDIMEIKYFFIILLCFFVFFFFPFSTFCFVQLLVIIVSTKLSTMFRLEKVYMQITGVAVS